VLKPTDFSHPSIRKARFFSIFEQYEDEVNRLNKHIDSLNIDITKLKESGNLVSASVPLCVSPSKDILQTLKTKLQFSQTSLEDSNRDRERLKDSNKKLESENSILMQDLVRLKSTLNEKNMMITSKYTVAALETKLESYEKEIKQLQKALEKSDKYIADLELKQREKENTNVSPSSLLTTKSRSTTIFKNVSPNNSTNNYNLISNSIGMIPNSCTNEMQSSTSYIVSPTNLSKNGGDSSHYHHHHHHHPHQQSTKYIKNDNQMFKSDLKIVKFSEKVDHIPININSLLSPPSSSSSSTTSSQPNQHRQVISKDNFYGSPSKMQPPQTPPHMLSSHLTSNSVSGLMSFSDRLKKNSININQQQQQQQKTPNISKFELESPSPLSQSLNGFGNGGIETQSLINYDSVLSNTNANNNNNHNVRCNSTTSNLNSNAIPHQFLFSPMKRLRLEEFTLEKPNGEEEASNVNATNLNEPTTQENNNRNNVMKTPPNPSPNHSHNLRRVSSSPSRQNTLDIEISNKNNSSKKNSFNISSKSPVNNSAHTVSSYTHKSRQKNDTTIKTIEVDSSDDFQEEIANHTNTNEKKKRQTTQQQQQNSSSSSSSEVNNSSREFIDCIELLNKAEKKVQNRFSPSFAASGGASRINTPLSQTKATYASSSDANVTRQHQTTPPQSHNQNFSGTVTSSSATTITPLVQSVNNNSSSSNYELHDKQHFRAQDQIVESSPLTISNVSNYNNSNKMNSFTNSSSDSSNNGLNGSKAVMASGSSFTLSSNSSNFGNSLLANVPTSATSSLASSHSSSGGSSFHSNTNTNLMQHTNFKSIEQNASNPKIRKFPSFDQNLNQAEFNTQLNEFSLNSTLTNKESQFQFETDAMNRSKSVDPISRNSKM
jgi:hypothetical protein